ncbi:CLUMA_CG004672, isoform A [Clunio marinus]|uniref:CLUMA_CG004672, isoform A n=1 Tax=Clunio marinus TaxID=568069 RepID=A0A1J1HSD0_9DIPT|nr:CLUMA_CG004672, isoform A [Clunio marinus]
MQDYHSFKVYSTKVNSENLGRRRRKYVRNEIFVFHFVDDSKSSSIAWVLRIMKKRKKEGEIGGFIIFVLFCSQHLLSKQTIKK